MSLFAAVVAAEEHTAPLIMPNWMFAVIAIAIALLLGFVTWSFRDVANRHSHRIPASSMDDSAHH